MNTIKVTADRKVGTIRALNGVDNGPVCFGELINSQRYYRQAAFPFIRLHDTNYPHPREVDIPEIFRDFNADPEDPASYDFRRTDTYLRQCLDTGAQIIYRLGVSIEHSKIKYSVDPPSDFEKWARVCRGIIRHYNDGWAEGFHWNIQYWEIWNEPDLLNPERSKDPMWSGTPEEYYELYKITSRTLKEYNPSMKIGGYAACGLDGSRQRFFNDFLDMVKKENLPLDFFSWHIYNNDPEQVCRYASIVEAGLRHIGYIHAESILDEWNYITPDGNVWEAIFSGEGDRARAECFSESKSHRGGAYVGAVLLALQDYKVDIATFYDGQPTNLFCTIFDCYGVPQKPYYSFLAFKELMACNHRVAIELPERHDGLYSCATVDDAGNARVMVVSYRSRPQQYTITVEGLDCQAVYRVDKLMMDNYHDLTLIDSGTGKLNELCLNTRMDAYSVMMIRLIKVS